MSFARPAPTSAAPPRRPALTRHHLGGPARSDRPTVFIPRFASLAMDEAQWSVCARSLRTRLPRSPHMKVVCLGKRAPSPPSGRLRDHGPAPPTHHDAQRARRGRADDHTLGCGRHHPTAMRCPTTSIRTASSRPNRWPPDPHASFWAPPTPQCATGIGDGGGGNLTSGSTCRLERAVAGRKMGGGGSGRRAPQVTRGVTCTTYFA